jgi:hypothetical protein
MPPVSGFTVSAPAPVTVTMPADGLAAVYRETDHRPDCRSLFLSFLLLFQLCRKYHAAGRINHLDRWTGVTKLSHATTHVQWERRRGRYRSRIAHLVRHAGHLDHNQLVAGFDGSRRGLL